MVATGLRKDKRGNIALTFILDKGDADFFVDTDTGIIFGTFKTKGTYRMSVKAVDGDGKAALLPVDDADAAKKYSYTFEVKDPPKFSVQPTASLHHECNALHVLVPRGVLLRAGRRLSVRVYLNEPRALTYHFPCFLICKTAGKWCPQVRGPWIYRLRCNHKL